MKQTVTIDAEGNLSNLSILECKYKKKQNKSGENRFQIYPYWNVNGFRRTTSTIGSAFQIYPYWNVNFFKCVNRCRMSRFQIYPYWNVNYVHAAIAAVFGHFQIYPYWNVNIAKTEQQPKAEDFKSIHIGM